MKYYYNPLLIMLAIALFCGINTAIEIYKDNKKQLVSENANLRTKIAEIEASEIIPKAEPIADIPSAIENLTDKLSKGSLQSNIYTVLGAEYLGTSDELNEILRAYSEMKIKQLKKGDKL